MRHGVMKSSRRHFDAMRLDSKMTGYPQPKSAHHQRGFLLDAKLITNNRTNCSKDEQQPCGFVFVVKHHDPWRLCPAVLTPERNKRPAQRNCGARFLA
jgi:hypothetical protein